MSITIQRVEESSAKTNIARLVLEELPDWFGIESSREEYIADCADRSFYAAFDGAEPVGFLALRPTGRETVEIEVMGILPTYHRQGIGRGLFALARREVKAQGFAFVQVKTVQMGRYASYDATNRFYLSLGFSEFEVFPSLWDAHNPCQIYVMAI